MSDAVGSRSGTDGGFWADFTGASDRWMRTFILALLLGRLSMIALGVAVVAAAGEGAFENFTGVIPALDPGVVFAAVIGAPLLESLIVLLLVWLIGVKLKASRAVTAVVTGLAFIPQHGLSLLSVAVAPFFALEALILHNWMRRGRTGGGFWLIFAIHAAANVTSVLAVAMMGPAAL